MTAKQTEEILNGIRKAHGVSTTEKDPIFAILIGTEVLFEDHLAKMDIQNMEFYAKLKSFTKEIQDEAKNLAEVRISRAVNGAFERLDEYKDQIEEVAATPPPPPEDKNMAAKMGIYFWYIPIFAMAIGFATALIIL